MYHIGQDYALLLQLSFVLLQRKWQAGIGLKPGDPRLRNPQGLYQLSSACEVDLRREQACLSQHQSPAYIKHAVRKHICLP